MRKIALISILTTYLVLNLGISMRFHYCGDSISFVDFFPVAENSCCGGKKPACCKDKIAYITPQSTQDNIQVVNFSFTDYAKFHFVNKDFSFLSTLKSEKNVVNLIGYDHDIFNFKVPLYIRNRVIIV